MTSSPGSTWQTHLHMQHYAGNRAHSSNLGNAHSAHAGLPQHQLGAEGEAAWFDGESAGHHHRVDSSAQPPHSGAAQSDPPFNQGYQVPWNQQQQQQQQHQHQHQQPYQQSWEQQHDKPPAQTHQWQQQPSHAHAASVPAQQPYEGLHVPTGPWAQQQQQSVQHVRSGSGQANWGHTQPSVSNLPAPVCQTGWIADCAATGLMLQLGCMCWTPCAVMYSCLL